MLLVVKAMLRERETRKDGSRFRSALQFLLNRPEMPNRPELIIVPGLRLAKGFSEPGSWLAGAALITSHSGQLWKGK